MLTNSTGNSFDMAPVLEECQAFINSIDDFTIETPGKTIETQDRIIQLEARESAKLMLTQSLFEYEATISKGRFELLKLLRSRRQEFQSSQYQAISQLNEIISRKSGSERVLFEDQQDRFLKFYSYSYTIIDVIVARLTGSELNSLAKARLETAGLTWPDKSNMNSIALSQEAPTAKQLTVRERVLIHCYKNLDPIERGDTLYNDYVTYQTHRKRIAYPNDSTSKAKSLVRSIKKILNYLNDEERKQAENEIDEIEANYSN